MRELSWGSDLGADGQSGGSDDPDGSDGCDVPKATDSLQRADLLQELRYGGSPLRQPVFEDQEATEASEGDQDELWDAAAAAHGSLAASWSPKRSLGVPRGGLLGRSLTRPEEACSRSTGQDSSDGADSRLQSCKRLATAAAGVARRRHAAQAAMSMSLDSGMFAAAYARCRAASAAGAGYSGGCCSSSSKLPPGGQARSQSQQKLGLRQPWRLAGQGLAAVPGGRRWTQQDALLAQAAAAAARRAGSISPAGVGGVPPFVQQQRLDVSKLRSRTPEPGRQQQ
ncbi:hypothetical protein COO60DRAFT_1022977 [Scenedesmus sp. NREL 46B-D3]|nr:hypothetical protein COO60DRAFT_1022977 [Scenedesmus sp. NREL 46B-D3]